MMKITFKVLALATGWHKGQKRKNGGDYISHPIAVAENAERIARYYLGKFLTDYLLEVIICIALLHDVLEDCNVTRAEMELALSDYPAAQVKLILDCVVLLTKTEKTESYLSYLQAVVLDTFAAIVKLGDLEHNLSDLAKGGLRDKYLLAQEYLKSRLDRIFRNEAHQNLYP